MLIWLTRFLNTDGVVWLPSDDPVDDLDTAGYKSNPLPLPAGGSYDGQHGARLPRRQRNLVHKGRLTEASAAAVQAAYNTISLASGTDGLLFGQNETGELTVFIPARLFVEPAQRTPVPGSANIYRFRGWWALDISMTFELYDTAWRGRRHGPTLAATEDPLMFDPNAPPAPDDTVTITTSPQTVTITNAGNVPVRDGVLVLTAAGTPITGWVVTCGKAKWTWTGSLPVGNALIMDIGKALIGNQTTLTAPAAAGATALPVANAAGTGWTAGGRIRIVLDDGTVVERAIASVTGTTTVNISPGLPGAAASGRAILSAAYSGFSRDTTLHTLDTWLELVPGNSSLVVALTGGFPGSTLSPRFWDAYI